MIAYLFKKLGKGDFVLVTSPEVRFKFRKGDEWEKRWLVYEKIERTAHRISVYILDNYLTTILYNLHIRKAGRASF